MPRGSDRTQLGANVTSGGTRFAVWSGAAERMWVSLFGHDGESETDRIELATQGEGVFATQVDRLGAGTRYGFRADGPYDPAIGHWFDPDKFLMDPYAVEIDRPYAYDPRLTAPRGQGGDTAPLMPKAIVKKLAQVAPAAPLFDPGGLVYEVPVRAFTMRHPKIPEHQRGTIAALAHPAIIDHLLRRKVSAVELMPVTARIDERHLPPLGLSNAWGYNPVSFMALDPRLAPGGIAELRDTVAALHGAGIGVILDLVFNHTGESDALGPTLSLRGLDNQACYRHTPDGRLVNDTGCGNTVATGRPAASRLILDSLRHFVRHTGVDGFRFDLAPILGRVDKVFDPEAPLLRAIAADPVLADRILIAEPWDLGFDGYQLGRFKKPFLEWNDRFRNDVRRFWRGDRGTIGALATRLAGSSDVFGGAATTRTVNFVAAHDGMALADLVAYERKHNEANGENNRDGHDENLSWNNGLEGATDDAKILARRQGDVRALLATLFASRGAIMLTAGDEFGRSQLGNNNAYAQDNFVTWLDWEGRDTALEAFVAELATLRATMPALRETAFLQGVTPENSTIPDVEWLAETGVPLAERDWNDPERHRLVMLLGMGDAAPRIAVAINGDRRASVFTLPQRDGFVWSPALDAARKGLRTVERNAFMIGGRAVEFFAEQGDAA